MNRRVIGFHEDDEHHWVAELECGHNQHVRHDPPWSSHSCAPKQSRVGALTLEITGPRKRVKLAVAGPVHRRVGHEPWTTSRPSIFHECDNLRELDAGRHTVETGYALE